MDLESAFRTAGVVNEAKLPESIHEEADARTGGADHVCQGLLGDGRDEGFRLAGLAELRHEQEDASEAALNELVSWPLDVGTAYSKTSALRSRDRGPLGTTPPLLRSGITVKRQNAPCVAPFFRYHLVILPP